MSELDALRAENLKLKKILRWAIILSENDFYPYWRLREEAGRLTDGIDSDEGIEDLVTFP